VRKALACRDITPSVTLIVMPSALTPPSTVVVAVGRVYVLEILALPTLTPNVEVNAVPWLSVTVTLRAVTTFTVGVPVMANELTLVLLPNTKPLGRVPVTVNE
jgi:hypothetical protein